MAIYAEDNAPGQSLPEFADDWTDGSESKDLRTFKELLDRGWTPKMDIFVVKDGNKAGVSIKLVNNVTDKHLLCWLHLATEAIHRHLDEKEKMAQQQDED